MARGEYDYIKGNTVISPQRKIEKPSRKRKNSPRINRNRKLKEKKKNDRKYVLNVAVIILCLGSMTILGDSRVYNMQKKVRDLDSQINELNESNEAFQITIMKFSSLKNIQSNAQSQLSMVEPTKDDVVKVDCSKNYFKNVKVDQNKNNSKNDDDSGLLSKIKNMFK